MATRTRPAKPGRAGAAGEVFLAFLRLGLTSFGGPVAHLGYLRDEFVVRRRWLDEQAYGGLVGLCQFLPGPASSQVGIGIGLSRAGLPGALAAWLGFTLPSALLMILLALGIALLPPGLDARWLHGLKVATVAVVAQAVWGMAKALAPDRMRFTLAAAACGVAVAWPSAAGQIAALAGGGLFGWRYLTAAQPGAPGAGRLVSAGRWLPLAAWALFFGLLAGLPLLRAVAPGDGVAIFDSFFRAGALVFGGGHVVLPMLQAEVVPPGWVTNDAFLAGYGVAQALPGPLFTFAAYLGASMPGATGGWLGGLLALTAIFLPAFLLVIGALPYWELLRHRRRVQSAMAGVNAAVVGVLLAALYQPVWTGAIGRPADFALGLAAFVLLMFWKAPPWLVVALCAAGGALLAAAG